MTPSPDRGVDPLDDTLRSASPVTTTKSPELDAQLQAMIADAQREARPERRPRPIRRIGLGITAAVLVFGGATAAAAGGQIIDWLPWAEDPEYVLHYTLPSGAECESRVGNYQGADPVVTDAIRDYAARVDLLEVADIDGKIAELRSGESYIQHEDGTQEPAGFGTEYYSADSEYDSAVSRAVGEAIQAELARQGFAPEAIGDSFEGQATCPGADW